MTIRIFGIICLLLVTACSPHKSPPPAVAPSAVAAQFKTLTFRTIPDISQNTMSKVVAITKQRLNLAKIRALVKSGSNGYIQVTIRSTSPTPYVSKMLTSPGNVSFRIYPRGARYESRRPISSAHVDKDPADRTVLVFTLADPKAFSAFTSEHLNQVLGTYIDGRLIETATLESPIDDSGELFSKALDPGELQFLAAIMGSEPLPARLRFVSSSPLTVS
ncbi:MAG TPA: hypothetical protein VGG89_04495 [Candidatus Baltobacteraceae bacterium]|jgi:preprotein translocase subunit SecD